MSKNEVIKLNNEILNLKNKINSQEKEKEQKEVKENELREIREIREEEEKEEENIIICLNCNLNCSKEILLNKFLTNKFYLKCLKCENYIFINLLTKQFNYKKNLIENEVKECLNDILNEIELRELRELGERIEIGIEMKEEREEEVKEMERERGESNNNHNIHNNNNTIELDKLYQEKYLEEIEKFHILCNCGEKHYLYPQTKSKNNENLLYKLNSICGVNCDRQVKILQLIHNFINSKVLILLFL